MLPCLDIFKIDPLGGVLWRGSVKSLVVAEARIKMLALSSPGDYLILNEDTGQRVLVTGSSLPHTDPLLWREDEDSACCTWEQAGALCYQKSQNVDGGSNGITKMLKARDRVPVPPFLGHPTPGQHDFCVCRVVGGCALTTIESFDNLRTAESYMKRIAAREPGSYAVFSRTSRQVVAKVIRNADA